MGSYCSLRYTHVNLEQPSDLSGLILVQEIRIWLIITFLPLFLWVNTYCSYHRRAAQTGMGSLLEPFPLICNLSNKMCFKRCALLKHVTAPKQKFCSLSHHLTKIRMRIHNADKSHCAEEFCHIIYFF